MKNQDDIGLSTKEIAGFSFLRVIRSRMDPANRQFQEDAAFEIEVSDAFAQKIGKHARGLWVPPDVLRHRPELNKRDYNTYVGSQGGYLVGTELRPESFIEALVAQMVCRELGATVLQNLKGDLSIPKKVSGGEAYWIGEGDDITESTGALGQVALRPKSVGAFMDLTRKFIMQSSLDAEIFTRQDLALCLALGIDQKALTGSGVDNEPLGILNTTGIGSVTLDAANTLDWGDVVDMETAIAIDNALVNSLAYVAPATICGNMKKSEKVGNTAKFIMEGGRVNGYPCMMSNQVTAGHIIFGNWRDLVIGEWSGVDVNVDIATLSKSGGIRVVVIQDVDVAVRHPESFADGYKE